MSIERVEFGIPGLDLVIPGGIRPGSLVVIAGAPGSGKSLLSSQLLMDMRWARTALQREKRPALLISCDERKDTLKTEIQEFFGNTNSSLDFETLRSRLAEGCADIIDNCEPPNEAARTILANWCDMQQAGRDHARQLVLQDMTKLISGRDGHLAAERVIDTQTGSPIKVNYRAICLDGLMNLAEFRGTSADERRNALYRTAYYIRSLMQSSIDSSQPCLATILTMELSEDPTRQVAEISEYLSDVVIRLGLDSPVKGARRRYLEITKSRYANSILGEHSLWIMSKDEIIRRTETNATVGWNRAMDHIRRGIVIFPRGRWSAEPTKQPLSPSLADAALNLRKSLSGIKDKSIIEELSNPKVIRLVEKMVRHRKLDQKDADVAQEFATKAITALTDAQRNKTLPANFTAIQVGEASRQLQDLADAIEHDAEESYETKDPSGYCLFGIDGLDAMFGTHEGRLATGVTRGTSTVVLGLPGTGKSTLAYCFMLKGLEQNEDVLFLSFDERHKRILRQVGGLTVSGEGSSRSPTLASSVAKQILLADATHKERPQLRFIHEHPVNTGLDELLFMLQLEVGTPRRNHEGADRRACRLIVDSLSDLERNIADPLIFNSFVSNLLKKVSDWCITTLLVLEGPAEPQETPDDRAMSHLADNVILLRQLQINNATRKCLMVQKARGRKHDLAAAELLYHQREDETLEVEVRKGFEGMTNVLTGRPQPANVELRLFHENARERACNKAFVRDMKEKFGKRLRYVPFTLAGARRTFWRQEDGKDIRPDADVTVMALDEPWVRIFAQTERLGHLLLEKWVPEHADASQRALIAQINPNLRRRAVKALDVGSNPTIDARIGHKPLEPVVAIPHYLDIGLLLCRENLVAGMPFLPTHWEKLGPGDQTSFEDIVGSLAKRLKVPALAFNMESMDTTACVFIEMCWNFFAQQRFLADPDDNDRHAATSALEFLARLRWNDLLPFPCAVKDCAAAIYTRAWYANIPSITTHAGSGNISLKPVPFFTSGRILGAAGNELRARLLEKIGRRRKELDDDLEHVSSRLEQQVAPTEQNYQDYVGWCLLKEQLNSDIERIDQRREEIEAAEKAAPGGWSCSGAWYLGVVSNGGNTNLGWSIVEEALDHKRMEERAFTGAGLPPYSSFYADHASMPVPGLTGVSFGSLERNFFGRTRPREWALGIGMGDEQSVNPRILQLCRELPEMLSNLVHRVLNSPKSKPNATNSVYSYGSNTFIREEVQRVFDCFQSHHLTSPAVTA